MHAISHASSQGYCKKYPQIDDYKCLFLTQKNKTI